MFAPPNPGPNSIIGETERIEVSWCLKNGYGTRLIPDGTILGAHFVQTPDYVQITGTGDLTKINVPKGDSGGELDPHGADGNGTCLSTYTFNSSISVVYMGYMQVTLLVDWYSLALSVVPSRNFTNGPTSCPIASSASVPARTDPRHLVSATTFTMLWVVVGTCLEIMTLVPLKSV